MNSYLLKVMLRSEQEGLISVNASLDTKSNLLITHIYIKYYVVLPDNNMNKRRIEL